MLVYRFLTVTVIPIILIVIIFIVIVIVVTDVDDTGREQRKKGFRVRFLAVRS